MDNEVIQYKPQPQALAISTVADVQQMGLAVAQSGMFGSCTPGRGAVIAAICQQEGYSLLEFKRTFHITAQGDVSMRADRMLAEFQRRGGTWKWITFNNTEARAVASFRENENVELVYTMDDAERAGLVKPGSNYEKHPAAMLRSRLETMGIRMLCPGAVCGTYTPEELADVYGVDVSAIEQSQAPRGDGPPQPADPARVQEAITTPWGQTEEALGEFDYGLCPIEGKLYQTRWEDMDFETLQIALTLDAPDMEPEHREAIKAAMAKKENA